MSDVYDLGGVVWWYELGIPSNTSIFEESLQICHGFRVIIEGSAVMEFNTRYFSSFRENFITHRISWSVVRQKQWQTHNS